ncbi:MAG: hypothetical protein GXP32_02785 [Kiritimatiellaeota bacterium]|nr:hypothetical protein [Kiritimatiellota bacterium]
MAELEQGIEIVWTDEEAERLFAEAGLAKFADFFEAERILDDSRYRVMREHRDKRGGGDVDRTVLKLDLDGRTFYLKRSNGEAYHNTVHEFEAIKTLPRFGLRPSEITAHSFDETDGRAMLLLKDLKGFNSINDMFNGNAPPEAVADFAENKERILAKVAEIIKKTLEAGYVYPDWFGKHIFVKPGVDEIALIDLERFRPLSECPWYFGFPVTSYFVKRKILRKLRRSLKSDLLPPKLLKRLFP